MLDNIKHYLSAGGFSLKLELQRQLEYPAFLIGWFIFCGLQFLAGVLSLKLITIQFQSINGWGFQELAFMYGLGIISHGISVVLFIQTWYLDAMVTQGGFDRMLLRPMNVYFQFLVCDINLIGLCDLLPGVIIFFYAAIKIGFQWSLHNIVSLIIIIAGATLIRGGMFTIESCVGFWTKRNGGLTSMFLWLMQNSMTYPLTIYGHVIQGIFTFLLPFGFIAFYPASSFFGKDAGFYIPGPVPLWTLAIGILFMLIGRGIFASGLKHYDSAGN